MASAAQVDGGKGGGFCAGLAAWPCDTCKSAPSLLFCGTDTAYLRGACDARVHGANKLASRHGRVWLCEVCEQAPATVTCKADAATLCAACDADIHSANPLARRHERAPIVPYFEPVASAIKAFSAAAAAAAADASSAAGGSGFLFGAVGTGDDEENEKSKPDAASWILPDHGGASGINPKGLMGPPELKPPPADYFFTEMDPYLDLDYVTSMDSPFQQTDSVVPVGAGFTVGAPPPAPAPSFFPPDTGIEFDFSGSKPSYVSYPAHSLSHSVSSSEVGVVPDGGGGGGGGSASSMGDETNLLSNPPVAPAVAMDREARVMRYREKRKGRRFQKTIRYASRKAYAETRPRIKGRFAKRSEIEAEVDRIYSSAAVLMMDSTGYVVVPSI